MIEKRIACLLLFAGPFLLWAQENPLSQKVNLRGQQIYLKDALTNLLHQDGVILLFSKYQVPQKVLDVNFEQQPLGKVLDEVLDQTELTYVVKGRQVVLMPWSEVGPRKKEITISGYIRDSLSGEALVSALVQVEGVSKGVVTNPYGFFSLKVPEGKTTLEASYLGYQPKKVVFDAHQDVNLLHIQLNSHLLLTEVLVTTYTDERNLFRDPEALAMDLLEEIPRLGGEADLLRLVYTQPGVQTDADGIGGMHVRGGGRGENLILIDGVQVYDLQHAGGLISIFNSDAIRSANFLKGGFPSRYGGRLSSVLDVRTKEGNLKSWETTFNGSMMTVGGKVEGPIIQDKMSLLFSGRVALLGFYLQPLTRNLRGAEGKRGDLDYRFFDINGKLSYKFSEKDRLYFSFYQGKDEYLNHNTRSDSLQANGTTYLFEELNKEAFRWGNSVGVLRWNHVISPNLFTNTSFSFSRLEAEGFALDTDTLFDLTAGNVNELHFDQRLYSSSIRDFSLRSDWDWTVNPEHQIRFGFGFTHHTFHPGIRILDEETVTTGNQVLLDDLPMETGREWWGYVEDDWDITRRLWLNLGLRYSGWENDGTFFQVLEPRLKANYLVSDRWLLKGSFGVNSQFVHLLSNSTIGLPTDIWVPSTGQTGFQKSWQLTLGTQYKIWEGLQLEVDLYYKNLNRLLALAEGLQGDTEWEKDVTIGNGRAMGAEFLLRLNRRRLNGWVGYSLGWTDRTFEQVNFGQRFPFRYDRRHSFDFLITYRLGNHLSISGQWEVYSGLAFNFPSEQFDFNYPGLPQIEVTGTDFGRKNDLRMPWYHRLDVGVDFNFVSLGRSSHFLHVGVYNLYNENNAFFFRLQSRVTVDDGQLVEKKEVEQVSLLPVLPSLSYRVRF